MNENDLIASFRPTQPSNQVQSTSSQQVIVNTLPQDNAVPPQQYLHLFNNS